MKNSKIHGYSIFIVLAVAYAVCPIYFILKYISARDLLIVLLTILCLYLIVVRDNFRLSVYRNNKRVIVAILIWSIITAIIQLYHGELSYAVKQILIWGIITTTGYRIINSKSRFITTLNVLRSLFLIVGVFGIIEEFTQVNIFDVLFNNIGAELNYNSMRLGIFRIISFTSHTITFCTFCMFGLCIIFYMQTIDKKRINIVTYIVLLLNAFFTLSRSCLIVILISQVMLLWMCGYSTFIKRLVEILAVIILVCGILSLISSTIRQYFTTASYVVLALFDDSYVTLLKNMGFTDNTSGIGTRFKIYGWVYERMAPDYLLGKGRYAEFAVQITEGSYSTIKTAIEVEWVQTLYRYGFVGLFAEIYYYLVLLFSCASKRWKTKATWEGKISYPQVMGSIVFGYILESFSVSQNNELQVFVLLLMLLLAYLSKNGFEESFGESLCEKFTT